MLPMHEAMITSQSAFAGLALTSVLAVLTWLVSLMRSDVSLVDRMWPAFIASPALVYLALAPSISTRGLGMIALCVTWALRLGLFITVRNWGHGEDRRYRAIRARNQPNFPVKSLYLVFALQAFLAWVVSAPLFIGVTANHPLGWLDVAGFGLAAFGLIFEAVGDAQMARFRAGAAQHGQVMDRGLWRYTRHPNYFGEACFWWGLWLTAVAGAGWNGAWSGISPLLMTILLLRVSGVRLLEQDIAERRPAYREYIARTNAFVPRCPRGRMP